MLCDRDRACEEVTMTVFEVAIRPEPTDGWFRVEVLSSTDGEASVLVQLDTSTVGTRRGDLQHAVLASAVPTRRVLPETERYVQEVGQQLFSALLGSGEVAGQYRARAAVAAERGEELRIILR